MSKRKKKSEELIIEEGAQEIKEEEAVKEEIMATKEPEIVIEETIEAIPEEETIEISEEEIKVGDFVILKDLVDYDGNEIPEKVIYKVGELHGNLCILKSQGQLIPVEINNLIKVK